MHICIWNSTRLSLLSALCCVVGLLLTYQGAWGQCHAGISQKFDHQDIHILPAPGAMVIDGDLQDWDMSGAITLSLDEASKKTMSVRAMMMYGADALYIAGIMRDPTPMVNNYSFTDEVWSSWNADAVQVRLTANPELKSQWCMWQAAEVPAEAQQSICHLTLWYSTRDKQAGCYIAYGLGFTGACVNPVGVAGAYKKAADGKGYTFEYRLPYNVLHAPRRWQGGDVIQTQWQVHWGVSTGKGLQCGLTDIRPIDAMGLGYSGPANWGLGILEKTGHVSLPEHASLQRANGHIPITFTLAKAGKASLAICDQSGHILRTCFGAERYPAGQQTYYWDGLDDFDHPVPAGAYQAKVLTHAGITRKLLVDVGVSGAPPYHTEDNTGGWAGDYGMPSYVAAEGDRVVLGTGTAEAAAPTIITDLNGKKLKNVSLASPIPFWEGNYGALTTGGAVTLHGGYGYFVQLTTGKLQKFDVATGYLANFSTGQPEATLLTRADKEESAQWNARANELRAITVAGKTLVVSSGGEDRLLLLDLASGALTGAAPLPQPFGLATSPVGILYAVSGNAVGRYDLQTKRFSPILAELDAPRHLACDQAGNLYVSLQGTTNQVWKLSPDGKVLLKFGLADGRPALGTFNERGMLRPYAIAVDRRGRLWVCEQDNQPKRYSLWNADGTFARDFFGSIDYASAASIDPDDPQSVYLQGVRYRVDYTNGKWRPAATVIRPRTDNDIPLYGGNTYGPPVFISQQGRTFCWGFDGYATGTLYEKIGEQFIPRLSSRRTPPAVWIDDNNDGRVQTEEVRNGASLGTNSWGTTVDSHLNLYIRGEGYSYSAPWGGADPVTTPYSLVRWEFKGFNAQGGLVYGDLAHMPTAVRDVTGGAVNGECVDTDGSLYTLIFAKDLRRGETANGSGNRLIAFTPTGEKRWEYRNVSHCFGFTTEIYSPGYIVSATKFCRGCSKNILAITGYYGQYFLVDKQDGLFIDALGQDQRLGPPCGPDVTYTENFNGFCYTAKNGKTYLLGGDADCRVWEIRGLETIRRQSAPVTVTAAMVARAAENAAHNANMRQAGIGKKMTTIPHFRKVTDNITAEWSSAPGLVILSDDTRAANGQLGYDDNNLYARFQVKDDSPLRNTPNDDALLFKTGDAVELQLGTDLGLRKPHVNGEEAVVGDLRLLVTRTPEGKMVATLYRPKIADTQKPHQHTFTSPTGTEAMDEVVAVNTLATGYTATADGYVVEIAIPWSLLGITPKSGTMLVGDLGIIYGNPGGTKNATRYLWSDHSPEVSINNDIPNESRIRPNQWGRLVLE